MNDRPTLTYIAIGGAAIAAVLLFFGAPLLSLLPFALLLICPVAMFFMMRSMSGSHTAGNHTSGRDHPTGDHPTGDDSTTGGHTASDGQVRADTAADAHGR